MRANLCMFSPSAIFNFGAKPEVISVPRPLALGFGWFTESGMDQPSPQSRSQVCLDRTSVYTPKCNGSRFIIMFWGLLFWIQKQQNNNNKKKTIITTTTKPTKKATATKTEKMGNILNLDKNIDINCYSNFIIFNAVLVHFPWITFTVPPPLSPPTPCCQLPCGLLPWIGVFTGVIILTWQSYQHCEVWDDYPDELQWNKYNARFNCS